MRFRGVRASHRHRASPGADRAPTDNPWPAHRDAQCLYRSPADTCPKGSSTVEHSSDRPCPLQRRRTVLLLSAISRVTPGNDDRMPRAMPLLAELIGASPGLVAVRTQAEQLLRRQSETHRLPSILILGETGTGKGLLARALHTAGPRKAGAFVAVNCAAIPETLLEAELFGHERGAFTDAREAKAGLFQTAHRGTLFLDEIGLLPQTLQAKLLTALEDRAVRRLGSTRPEPVDVWIISVTSEDLKAGGGRRGFREELYHRLAVVTLRLPPLRERRQDILTLAEHFLARTCTEYGVAPKTLTEDARGTLVAYRWPGNVRELANVMERAVLLVDGPMVRD